jgi:peptidyl-prolyl cis-trans isomerase SurA
MINSKLFIFAFTILAIFNLKVLSMEDVFILYKIDNKIITNIDIEKEAKYLIALNNQLKNLEKSKIFKIAKESAVRENIKKIELLKYFNLENESKNKDFESYIKNIYLQLKLNNKREFEEYLNSYGLTTDYVEKKIQIEVYWNQLIYEKYKNQLNIDIIKLKDEIKKNEKKLKEKTYELSEIIFEIDGKNNFDKKNQSINESINEIGFKNTANIYSISDSAKFGGNIGWIEETKLSKNILKIISKLDVGDHSSSIQIGSNYLILKIEEIKFKKKVINADEVLEKKIQFETSQQLDRFSKIFYKKVKINLAINAQ